MRMVDQDLKEVGNQRFLQGANNPSPCQVHYDQEMPNWPSYLLASAVQAPRDGHSLCNHKWVSIISAVFVRLIFFFSFPAFS